MKIIELKAENIKKIKAIDIKPEGNIVLITGENGAGKTSVLDCIMYAFCGKEVLPPKPVREGAESGKVEVDLGDYIVTRIFSKTDSRVEIKNKEGFKSSSPQAMLDSIVGRIAFDPLEFARMKPKEQREFLMHASGVDTISIDEEIAKVYAQRMVLNRQVSYHEAILKKQYNELSDHTRQEILPDAEEQIETLTNQLNTSIQSLTNRQFLADKIKSITKTIASTKQQINALKEQIRILEKSIASNEKDMETAKKELDNLSIFEPEEIEAIQLQIKQLQFNAELKKKFEEYEKNEAIFKNTILHERNEAESRLAQLRQQKVDMLNLIKMPVPEMTFNDDVVMVDNIPFEQLNEAKQIEISMRVAMAMNPTLRVIKIANGSALGTKALNLIASIAAKHDYQVWIEKMDESGKIGIVIEEGEVKIVNKGSL